MSMLRWVLLQAGTSGPPPPVVDKVGKNTPTRRNDYVTVLRKKPRRPIRPAR
jgi:hypothetical protein